MNTSGPRAVPGRSSEPQGVLRGPGDKNGSRKSQPVLGVPGGPEGPGTGSHFSTMPKLTKQVFISTAFIKIAFDKIF